MRLWICEADGMPNFEPGRMYQMQNGPLIVAAASKQMKIGDAFTEALITKKFTVNDVRYLSCSKEEYEKLKAFRDELRQKKEKEECRIVQPKKSESNSEEPSQPRQAPQQRKSSKSLAKSRKKSTASSGKGATKSRRRTQTSS